MYLKLIIICLFCLLSSYIICAEEEGDGTLPFSTCSSGLPCGLPSGALVNPSAKDVLISFSSFISTLCNYFGEHEDSPIESSMKFNLEVRKICCKFLGYFQSVSALIPDLTHWYSIKPLIDSQLRHLEICVQAMNRSSPSTSCSSTLLTGLRIYFILFELNIDLSMLSEVKGLNHSLTALHREVFNLSQKMIRIVNRIFHGKESLTSQEASSQRISKLLICLDAVSKARRIAMEQYGFQSQLFNSYPFEEPKMVSSLAPKRSKSLKYKELTSYAFEDQENDSVQANSSGASLAQLGPIIGSLSSIISALYKL